MEINARSTFYSHNSGKQIKESSSKEIITTKRLNGNLPRNQFSSTLESTVLNESSEDERAKIESNDKLHYRYNTLLKDFVFRQLTSNADVDAMKIIKCMKKDDKYALDDKTAALIKKKSTVKGQSESYRMLLNTLSTHDNWFQNLILCLRDKKLGQEKLANILKHESELIHNEVYGTKPQIEQSSSDEELEESDQPLQKPSILSKLTARCTRSKKKHTVGFKTNLKASGLSASTPNISSVCETKTSLQNYHNMLCEYVEENEDFTDLSLCQKEQLLVALMNSITSASEVNTVKLKKLNSLIQFTKLHRHRFQTFEQQILKSHLSDTLLSLCMLTTNLDEENSSQRLRVKIKRSSLELCVYLISSSSLLCKTFSIKGFLELLEKELNDGIVSTLVSFGVDETIRTAPLNIKRDVILIVMLLISVDGQQLKQEHLLTDSLKQILLQASKDKDWFIKNMSVFVLMQLCDNVVAFLNENHISAQQILTTFMSDLKMCIVYNGCDSKIQIQARAFCNGLLKLAHIDEFKTKIKADHILQQLLDIIKLLGTEGPMNITYIHLQNILGCPACGGKTIDEMKAKVEEIKAKDDEIKAKNDEIKAKDDEIKAKNAEIKAKDEALKAQDEEIKDKNDEIKAKDDEIKAKNAEIKAKDEALKAQDEEIKDKNDEIKANEKTFKAKHEALKAKDDEIKAEDDEIKAEDDKIKAEDDELKANDDETKVKNDGVKAKGDEMREELKIENLLPDQLSGRNYLCDPIEAQELEEINKPIPDKIRKTRSWASPDWAKSGILSEDQEFVTATEKEFINLLLVGKTGNGKSATGNYILKRPYFKTESVTEKVKYKMVEYKKYHIKVVDGPGVGDDYCIDVEASLLEMAKMRDAFLLNPDSCIVFLLVINYGNRLTAVDKANVMILKVLFGPDFFKDYCILVVTNGDGFNVYKKEAKVKFKNRCREQKQKKIFKELLTEWDNRNVIFYNNSKEKAVRKKQMNKLLELIDALQFATKSREQLMAEIKEPLFHQKSLENISIILQELDAVNQKKLQHGDRRYTKEKETNNIEKIGVFFVLFLFLFLFFYIFFLALLKIENN